MKRAVALFMTFAMTGSLFLNNTELSCASEIYQDYSEEACQESTGEVLQKRIGEAAQNKSLENPTEETKKDPALGYQIRGSSRKKKQASNISWSLEDGVLTISGNGAMANYSQTERPEWENQGSAITSVVIEEGITSIGEMAFYKSYSLEEISVPSTVSSIGRIAFAECSSLKEIIIPDAVTVLPYGVFANCRSLTNISCNKVTSIEDYAFQKVPLPTFTVPATLTQLSSLAFFNAGISEYQVEAGNTTYTVEDGILYTNQGKTLFAYPTGKEDETFVVPSHVTEIGSLAMSYTTNLTSVTIGNSVNKLGESAFQEAGLTSVTIPDSVTTVGYFTFYGCPNLVSVTFGKGLKTTSYQMFRECSSLQEIHFGNTLQVLDAHTFAYCRSLKSVEVPASIKEIGVGSFGECYALESFKSSAITNVPYSAFWNCYKLQEVVLNEGVKDIYRAAFYNCESLMAITLPNSVKYVHSVAFPDWTVITCKNPNMKPYGQNGYRYIQQISITGERDYGKAFEVLSLVNAERAKKGLGALTMNASLMESAMVRAAETAICFSHTRPDGSSCFDINSAMYAENIAAGNTTAQAVMNSWMNSAGHRGNILLEDAGNIGIGCFIHNGVTYWVQCFGQAKGETNCTKPANKKVTQKIALATETFDEAATSAGVIFGSSGSYTYKFRIQFGKNKINPGATTTAKLCLTNPGFSSVAAVLDNVGITWKSNKSAVAQINSTGKITGVKAGSATITGSLQYYNAGSTITIAGASTKEIAKVKKQLKKGEIKSIKKIKHKSIKVTCKKQKNVSGYEVRLATNKKMKKATVRTAKKRKVTFKKLKKGKKYYIQVRVFKKVSGQKVYGKWGKKKKVKL